MNYTFSLEEMNFQPRSLIPSKQRIANTDHPQNKVVLNKTVYIEVDMELLLLYTLKSVAIVRGPRGQENPTFHFSTELDDNTLIKDWIEAGMPEPWCK